MAAQPEAFSLRVPDQAIAIFASASDECGCPITPPVHPGPSGPTSVLCGNWPNTGAPRLIGGPKVARPNAFAQYKAPLCRIDLHFLHAPGPGPAPCPLLRLLANAVREFFRPLRERRSA